METRIYRSILEPIRTRIAHNERWHSEDKGLISCWETGRKLSETMPETAEAARNNELPVLGWKGGIAKKIKDTKTKFASLYYLAQWQGLRGEDLNIDLSEEILLTCSKTNVTFLYTSDYKKYSEQKKPLVDENQQ